MTSWATNSCVIEMHLATEKDESDFDRSGGAGFIETKIARAVGILLFHGMTPAWRSLAKF